MANNLTLDGYVYEIMEGTELVRMFKDEELLIWKENRSIDTERVKQMEEDIKLSITMGPCPIHIAKYGDNKYIVDGQHRISVLSNLPTRITTNLRILCCTVDCEKEEDIFKLFKVVNAGVSVVKSYTNKDFGNTIKKLYQIMESEYSSHVKTSKSCNRPNFSKDKLMEKLGRNENFFELVKEKQLDENKLFDFMIDCNKEIRTQYKGKYKKLGASDAMIAICKKSKFYLPLHKTWLDYYINHITEYYDLKISEGSYDSGDSSDI
jgi:hypothetical protein